jgi:AsmA protein
MSMSATARNGIISSNDFLLKGSMSSIKGSGEISLATLAIDARAVMTLVGIPELPFTISGTLGEPKISYKVLGAVTGTVGNIGSTLFDIVGGILTAPIRLVTGNRFLGGKE